LRLGYIVKQKKVRCFFFKPKEHGAIDSLLPIIGTTRASKRHIKMEQYELRTTFQKAVPIETGEDIGRSRLELSSIVIFKIEIVGVFLRGNEGLS
jgi:hypothetical protein